MADRKISVFNFNHISSELSEDHRKALRALYRFYHKKYWLFKMTFKYLKKIELTCNISSAVLMVTGTVVGSVTMNPIALGCITGSGLVLKTYVGAKNFKRKIEMCKFAYTSNENFLIEIRSYLRGLEFDEKEFLDSTKVLDNIIIDMCPVTDKFNEKYNKMIIN